MKARLRSFIAAGIIVAVLIACIFAAYRFDWPGTGFSNKTLWDWLQLLIIPLALAGIALVFQLANTRTERQIAKERYEQDQQIALDKQHEDLLQAYLDRISELLLKESLRTSPSEEVRNVARVRTITVLTQLNARRIGFVLAFLREAGLMSTTPNSSVVSLKDADLHAVDWSQADLQEVNLSEANLSEANLSEAILEKANLSGAGLGQANLSGADLSGANLSEARLWQADLVEAHLRSANLSGANLGDVNLRDADLNSANLSGADLSGANLREANLYKANLRAAHLRSANLSGANLGDVNLRDADLNNANLSGADLYEVDLRDADLRFALQLHFQADQHQVQEEGKQAT